MGTDIRTRVEVRHEGHWQHTDVPAVFDWRDYGLYGFLADVRNYSHSPVIADSRGLPDDADMTVEDREFVHDMRHSASWLTAAELTAFDYEQVFWDRRVTREISPGSWDGAALAGEGEGEHVTMREFLGPAFFADLERLRSLGNPADVRIIFWFGS